MMTRLATEPLPGTVRDPLYPDSDGRPMGDTDYHTTALIWLRQGLEDFFDAVIDVYVATNLLFYYQQGNPRARRDPDILVAKGVGKHKRRSYRIWEEKKLPSVFFEVASENTWRVDVGDKRELYARIGINEYFLFDPEARYLDAPLLGFRTENGVSVPMIPAADGSLISAELGLRLVPEGEMLRLIDLRTGKPILTRAEQSEHHREQVERAKEEAEREKEQAERAKEQAEREKEQAERAKEQAERAKEQAAREKEQAQQAKELAERERQRSTELAAEVERLKALLAQREPPMS